MKTRIFDNPVKFTQSVKIKVDGEYVSLLELLQNADIELDETPTSGSDKAVSSGGVFNALQEKQGQISITKNDDGSVDINIPDAGEVSSGGVTIIQVNELTPDDEGVINLDLSKNGKYMLIECPQTTNIRCNFGYCKDIPTRGKFCVDFAILQNVATGGCDAGYEDNAAYATLYDRQDYYIEVNDNTFYVTSIIAM